MYTAERHPARSSSAAYARHMSHSQTADLQSQCDLLRSLHRSGEPLLLPNAWDVATARSVVAAGFPVVATTSAGVSGTLGYEDHEGAPGDEMLAAAARIARGVEVPVTVDAEAGYGMEPAELVAALRSAGAAGCNLEDTDHSAGSLRDADQHAEWLRAVRQAASEDGYGLVINARIDVFLGPLLAGAGPGTQGELVPEAVRRANAYLEAGVDCVYPIVLWETDALRRFTSDVGGPVNVVRLPQAPSVAELAAIGVARVSWGLLLYSDAMARFEEQLASLRPG
jgi:2-methylisocitrate lyase-like PEP mutase family enzyme